MLSLKPKWTYDLIADFIEMYKSLPCLWDQKSPGYNNKTVKNKAYAKFVNKLRESDPTITRDVVVKKINNLRSCYRKEFKKVKVSKQRGDEDIYEPSLWYFHRMDFLYDNENEDNGEHTENMEAENDSQDNCLKHSPEFCSVNEEDDDTNSQENDKIPLAHLQKSQNAASTNLTDPMRPANTEDIQPCSPLSTHSMGPVNARATNDDALRRVNNGRGVNNTRGVVSVNESNLHGFRNYVNNRMPASNQQSCNVLTFGNFGAYIADELTNLPPQASMVCQKLINDVIFEAKCGTLSRHSRVVTGANDSSC